MVLLTHPAPSGTWPTDGARFLLVFDTLHDMGGAELYAGNIGSSRLTGKLLPLSDFG
jgi:hypothetical protein